MNLLVHLSYLAPLVAGLVILAGAPARKTAITASLIAAVSSLIVFLSYDRATAGFQFLSSVPLAQVVDWSLGTQLEGTQLGFDGCAGM